MNRLLLKQMEKFLFLYENSDLKDLSRKPHTILLLEDFIEYKRNKEFNASYEMLVYLRFLNIDYEIIDLNLKKPILCKFQVAISELSPRIRQRVLDFEKWVLEQ